MNRPLHIDSGAPTPEATATAISDLLPADTLGYSVLGADLSALWAELRTILGEGAPDLLAVLDVLFISSLPGLELDPEADR